MVTKNCKPAAMHTLRWSIALALIFILPGYSSAQSVIQIEKRANEAFEKKQFDLAKTDFQQLLARDPISIDYNFKYAVCLYFSNDRLQSKKYFTFIASQSNPPCENAYYLGKIYQFEYNFDRAIQWYKAYQSCAPAKGALSVKEEIMNCESGKILLKKPKALSVVTKTSTLMDLFYKKYNYDVIGGGAFEDLALQSKLDKKKGYTPHYYFRKGEKIKVFSSYNEASGRLELFYITKTSPDDWSKPKLIQSLSEEVADKCFPYFDTPSQTLYFSSNGFNAMGGFDLFKTTFDPIANSIGTVTNLDFPFSSVEDDFYFIPMDSLNQMATFASTRNSARGKIEIFEIKLEEFSDQIIYVKGQINDQVDPQNKTAQVTVVDENDGKVYGPFPTDNQGNYNVILPGSGNFRFMVKFDGTDKTFENKKYIPKQQINQVFSQNITYLMADGIEKAEFSYEFDVQEMDALAFKMGTVSTMNVAPRLSFSNPTIKPIELVNEENPSEGKDAPSQVGIQQWIKSLELSDTTLDLASKSIADALLAYSSKTDELTYDAKKINQQINNQKVEKAALQANVKSLSEQRKSEVNPYKQKVLLEALSPLLDSLVAVEIEIQAKQMLLENINLSVTKMKSSGEEIRSENLSNQINLMLLQDDKDSLVRLLTSQKDWIEKVVQEQRNNAENQGLQMQASRQNEQIQRVEDLEAELVRTKRDFELNQERIAELSKKSSEVSNPSDPSSGASIDQLRNEQEALKAKLREETNAYIQLKNEVEFQKQWIQMTQDRGISLDFSTETFKNSISAIEPAASLVSEQVSVSIANIELNPFSKENLRSQDKTPESQRNQKAILEQELSLINQSLPSMSEEELENAQLKISQLEDAIQSIDGALALEKGNPNTSSNALVSVEESNRENTQQEKLSNEVQSKEFAQNTPSDNPVSAPNSQAVQPDNNPDAVKNNPIQNKENGTNDPVNTSIANTTIESNNSEGEPIKSAQVEQPVLSQNPATQENQNTENTSTVSAQESEQFESNQSGNLENQNSANVPQRAVQENERSVSNISLTTENQNPERAPQGRFQEIQPTLTNGKSEEGESGKALNEELSSPSERSEALVNNSQNITPVVSEEKEANTNRENQPKAVEHTQSVNEVPEKKEGSENLSLQATNNQNNGEENQGAEANKNQPKREVEGKQEVEKNQEIELGTSKVQEGLVEGKVKGSDQQTEPSKEETQRSNEGVYTKEVTQETIQNSSLKEAAETVDIPQIEGTNPSIEKAVLSEEILNELERQAKESKNEKSIQSLGQLKSQQEFLNRLLETKAKIGNEAFDNVFSDLDLERVLKDQQRTLKALEEINPGQDREHLALESINAALNTSETRSKGFILDPPYFEEAKGDFPETTSWSSSASYDSYVSERKAVSKQWEEIQKLNQEIDSIKGRWIQYLSVNSPESDAVLEGLMEKIKDKEDKMVLYDQQVLALSSTPNATLFNAMIAQGIVPKSRPLQTSVSKYTAVNMEFAINEKTSPVMGDIPFLSTFPKGLVFTVQVGAFRKPVPSKAFSILNPVNAERLSNGLVCIVAGFFENSESANASRKQIRSAGFSDAFLVSYCDGIRIPLYQALQMERNGGCSVRKKEELLAEAASLMNAEDEKQKGTMMNEEVYITVQVAALKSTTDEAKFKGIPELFYTTSRSGLVKYSSGKFTDITMANARKQEARKVGFSDAYLVAYRAGQPITIAEAKDWLARKQQMEQLASNQKVEPVNTDLFEVIPLPPKPRFIYFKMEANSPDRTTLSSINKNTNFSYQTNSASYLSGPYEQGSLSPMVWSSFANYSSESLWEIPTIVKVELDPESEKLALLHNYLMKHDLSFCFVPSGNQLLCCITSDADNQDNMLRYIDKLGLKYANP